MRRADDVMKTQESAKLRAEAAEVRKELELARAEVRYNAENHD